MLRGGAEVPEDRLIILRQQRETADLVLRPGADVRRRDVTDVVHVEAEHGAELRLLEELLDPRKPLPAQPIEIDPLLPIHRHRSVCLQCQAGGLLISGCTSGARARPRRAHSGPSSPRAAAKTGWAHAWRP